MITLSRQISNNIIEVSMSVAGVDKFYTLVRGEESPHHWHGTLDDDETHFTLPPEAIQWPASPAEEPFPFETMHAEPPPPANDDHRSFAEISDGDGRVTRIPVREIELIVDGVDKYAALPSIEDLASFEISGTFEPGTLDMTAFFSEPDEDPDRCPSCGGAGIFFDERGNEDGYCERCSGLGTLKGERDYEYCHLEEEARQRMGEQDAED